MVYLKLNEMKNKYKLIKVAFGYQLEVNGKLIYYWFGQNMPQHIIDEYGELLDKTQTLLKRSKN